jgi:hypothetical protein
MQAPHRRFLLDTPYNSFFPCTSCYPDSAFFPSISRRVAVCERSFDNLTWYGPIAHGDHLGQAAGLEHGRHQQNVRSRKQQVGQGLAAQGGTVQNPGKQIDAQSMR